MPPIYLIAPRDYFAYVGTAGFWVSLLLMPLLFAVFALAPILLLAHAEPPRVIAVRAEQPADAAVVDEVFKRDARQAARGDI
jgi:ABC-2 type transport system permease protein